MLKAFIEEKTNPEILISLGTKLEEEVERRKMSVAKAMEIAVRAEEFCSKLGNELLDRFKRMETTTKQRISSQEVNIERTIPNHNYKHKKIPIHTKEQYNEAKENMSECLVNTKSSYKNSKQTKWKCNDSGRGLQNRRIRERSGPIILEQVLFTLTVDLPRISLTFTQHLLHCI